MAAIGGVNKLNDNGHNAGLFGDMILRIFLMNNISIIDSIPKGRNNELVISVIISSTLSKGDVYYMQLVMK